MAVSREDILQLLKMRGPLVPNAIKKVLGGDSIILGATLAELSSRKLVKLTHLKKGGSPFYYLPGQEAQLENCVEYLNPKDADTVAFLREKKVVADRELELFQRVSMRQIKDFAKEFKAQTSQGELLFWHYYLVSEQEAINLLNQRNKPAPQQTPPAQLVSNQSTIPQNNQQTTQSTSSLSQSNQSSDSPSLSSQNNSSSALAQDTPATNLSAEPVSSQPVTNISELVSEPSPSQPPVEQKQNPSLSAVSFSSSESKESVSSPAQASAPFQSETHSSKPKKEITKPQTSSIKEKPSKKLLPKKEESINEEEPLALESTPFLQRCRSYFKEKNILILEEELIKKNAEYEFIVLTPSPVGDLSMFVRAKDKKRLNEGDVAPALLRAKTKDLTCLFLTTGEFTKKSLSLIKDEYQGLLISYFE